jgi:hypothetical protein
MKYLVSIVLGFALEFDAKPAKIFSMMANISYSMKYLMIFLMLMGLVMLSYFISNSFASCIENEDWLDAPCMDSFPINRVEFQKDWKPYYDYKGSELMESKYVEMQQAINDGTFNEWKSNRENSNVYYYYLSVDKVPNQQERFIFDDEVETYSSFPPYFVIALASIFVIIIVVIVIAFVSRRKRK